MVKRTSQLMPDLVKRLYPKQPVVGVGAVIIQNGKIHLKNEKASLDVANGAYQAV
ncbi:MAG: hypothetical protein ACPLZY_02375 [Candidatus Norongarragalinales archaeon]